LAKNAWTNEELAQLQLAVGKYPGGTGDRWGKIAKFLGSNRDEQEIIAKVRDLTKRGRDKNSNTNVINEKDKKEKDKSKDKDKEKKEDKEKKKNKEKEDKKEINKASNIENEWSLDQQKALENALKQVKDLPVAERWDKVAEMVPGKNKKECMERFKYIREQLLAKQQPK